MSGNCAKANCRLNGMEKQYSTGIIGKKRSTPSRFHLNIDDYRIFEKRPAADQRDQQPSLYRCAGKAPFVYRASTWPREILRPRSCICRQGTTSTLALPFADAAFNEDNPF